MRHAIEYCLFQLFKWVILALPLKSAQRLGYYCGSVAYYFFSSRRVVAIENLHFSFPDKSESEILAIVKGAFCNYGIAIAEFLWFPNLTEEGIRRLIDVQNIDVMTDRYSPDKGMIMLSGHFGNWELIALGFAYLSRIPMTIIVQTQSNRLVDAVVNRHRCLFGNKVVPMGMSVREIIRTLNAGGLIAIASDQSGPMEGVFVEFFGRSVGTHQGPAAFALRASVPVVMGFLIRKPDWTYEAILEEVPSDDLHGYTDENVVELTRRHTALLEKYIRLHPDHWLWMHRRWKHTLDSVVREKQAFDSLHA